MKLILDLDDVLLDASKLKQGFFSVLEQQGIQNPAEKYFYERKNDRPFSLKGFIERVCKEEHVTADPQSLYEEIMSICPEIKNREMVSLMEEAGKDNCYIVSNGDQLFQSDKIMRSGVGVYAEHIFIVPGSKKEVVEDICRQFPAEKVIFIDDKDKFFSDINMMACKNLITCTYVGQTKEELLEEVG